MPNNSQSDLQHLRCDACQTNAPGVTDHELSLLIQQIPLWSIIETNSVKQLMREFKFTDFQQALFFTQHIGELAEQEGHHPAILTEWGKVTVHWWTHKIHGLHRNDFIMAAKTDSIYQEKWPLNS